MFIFRKHTVRWTAQKLIERVKDFKGGIGGGSMAKFTRCLDGMDRIA